MNGDLRAKLGEALEIGFEVDVSFAHGGPLHLGSGFGFPDHGIAQAGAGGVGRENLEVSKGIFEGPGGIAGVDVGADIIRSGGLDEGDEFPGLHVAGMIFDGDLDARVQGLAAAGAADFDRVRDARFDAALGVAILAAAEDDAERW